MTPQARAAVAGATDLFGYGPYVDRVEILPHQTRHASDNREEIARAGAALAMAAKGRHVAVVSGGDAGVFAMAAAVCEAIEQGPAEWRAVDLDIVPGVTAMLAVAARAGAPLGHDFCAISLSDNLKPWELIEARLRAVSAVGLVIALYNPISRARPWQLGRAFEILREHLPAATPVIFGRAAGRPDERLAIAPLGEADAAIADMATCVIIGSAETRLVTREDLPPLVYSPRSAGRPSA
jgi:precorrin-3B C17-methyltransferase